MTRDEVQYLTLTEFVDAEFICNCASYFIGKSNYPWKLTFIVSFREEDLNELYKYVKEEFKKRDNVKRLIITDMGMLKHRTNYMDINDNVISLYDITVMSDEAYDEYIDSSIQYSKDIIDSVLTAVKRFHHWQIKDNVKFYASEEKDS